MFRLTAAPILSFAVLALFGLAAAASPTVASKPARAVTQPSVAVETDAMLTSSARLADWHYLNCPHGHPAFPETCWADSAYQKCKEGQTVYDFVMKGKTMRAKYNRYRYSIKHCTPL
jgi:hypothetical protein